MYRIVSCIPRNFMEAGHSNNAFPPMGLMFGEENNETILYVSQYYMDAL